MRPCVKAAAAAAIHRPSRRISGPALAAAALLAAPAMSGAQSLYQQIGLTQLLAIEPGLTGAGVTVGQAEANFSTSGGNEFEVNPA